MARGPGPWALSVSQAHGVLELLRAGYGVEDAAVNLALRLDDVRAHVSHLRASGKIWRVFPPHRGPQNRSALMVMGVISRV